MGNGMTLADTKGNESSACCGDTVTGKATSRKDIFYTSREYVTSVFQSRQNRSYPRIFHPIIRPTTGYEYNGLCLCESITSRMDQRMV